MEQVRTLTHWGAFDLEVADGKVIAVSGIPEDPNPSPIGQSLAGTLNDACRITQPMVRESYLRDGPLAAPALRGRENFVPVSWRIAETLVVEELQRVIEQHGNSAIYGGCYGWASAGRFHHAQSQVHRFLNCIGGYTRSVDTYSLAAGEVILPHVLGEGWPLVVAPTSWPSIISDTELMVTFGGMPLKNTQINAGGTLKHRQEQSMRDAKDAGVAFVNISPIRDDTADFLDAQWIAARPNTDVAIMLGLAHTLLVEDRVNVEFLDRYCVGHEQFFGYLRGQVDGQPKDADWAAAICGLDRSDILELARYMSRRRTMISVSWSLTRQDHGEQPYWMAVVLAAMLGDIGLPGGGVSFGYSAENKIGYKAVDIKLGSFPGIQRRIDSFIPVARVADMLLHPGESFDYNGGNYAYPDIRLVYWAGGNPFHHHQDLNRLQKAWQRPETIISHEIWWNATARRADIVLPVTSPLERNDIGGTADDGSLQAMRKAVEPPGLARNDHDIFVVLAGQMGCIEDFNEGLDEAQWLQRIYRETRERAAGRGFEMPEFEAFWEQGSYRFPKMQQSEFVMLEAFRNNPKDNPLKTPSGKIEIFSETISSFNYPDCPGHATWLEPVEWLGGEQANELPLHLISNQPATRLHSQLDNGTTSQAIKIQGREPVRINPDDAAARQIRDGDIVEIRNARGAILAGAIICDDLMQGVIQIATGAWWDPEYRDGEPFRCRHGNVNALTLDKGTSRLAQGPSALSCLVEIEVFKGELPPLRIFEPPP